MATLRFGIGDHQGNPGTRYWALKTSASRPDFYIRGSRTGEFFGVSIHEDENHWHWKVRRPGQPASYMTFPPPPALVPGLVRAQCLVSHAVVATRGPRVHPRKTSSGSGRRVPMYVSNSTSSMRSKVLIPRRGPARTGWERRWLAE
jgi:hypothetical protein